MTPSHKNPGLAFWATVALVVVLLYVASIGPACWIVSRTGIGQKALPAIYRPVTIAMTVDDTEATLRKRLTPGPLSCGPGTATLYFYPSDAMSRYAELFAARGWHWRLSADFEYQPDPIVRLTKGQWEWRDDSWPRRSR